MTAAPADAPPVTAEVSDGIYAYLQPDGSWYLNNTGFITGRQGVISIDTCSTERRTRAYLAAIAAVSRQPVRTLSTPTTTATIPTATACCPGRPSWARHGAGTR